MRTMKLFALLSLGLLIAPFAAQGAQFGVEVGVGPAYVGAAPACPYGYYDYYPYACAPYGFYGPDWFSGGVFIGAGPWFHGDRGGRGFYAGRGFDRGPVARDRGDYGRMPAFAAHPAFRGDVNRGSNDGRFNQGGAFHGGGSFHGSASSHGGGGSRGRGRR